MLPDLYLTKYGLVIEVREIGSNDDILWNLFLEETTSGTRISRPNIYQAGYFVETLRIW